MFDVLPGEKTDDGLEAAENAAGHRGQDENQDAVEKTGYVHGLAICFLTLWNAMT
jgi:hypothetical protein